MSVPNAESLYHILCDDAVLVERTRQAMSWLLSDKAEGIGQKLLKDAYSLHGKPVTVSVSETEETAYHPEQHMIIANPRYDAMMSFGGTKPTSVECSLAHEMTHAGQPDLENTLLELGKLEQQIRDHHAQRFLQRYAAQKELFERMLDAKDDNAKIVFGKRYTKEAAALEGEIYFAFQAHPQYRAFIKKFEDPAVEIENKVAALRGEPLRVDYLTAPDISPHNASLMQREELKRMLGLGQKQTHR